jgi:hypothetical protein
VGKRGRRQEKLAGLGRLTAPDSDYSDDEGNVLTLRGSLRIGSRRALEQAAEGSPLSREDAWQRALEVLFERLAVRWTIAGVPTEDQKELLARFRIANADERRWVRETLRRHCAEYFPGLETP